MKFHHIGIATNNIDLTLDYIKKTNTHIQNITEVLYDELQKAYLCMVTLSDGTNIELVSGGQVSTFLKKNIQLYHTCWEVSNLETSIKEQIQSKAILISGPKKAILFDNRRVAFLLTDIGILELLEKESINESD